MKNRNQLLIGICVILSILVSCKKSENILSNLSSVNVINAVVNVPAIKVNYFGKPIVWSNYTAQVSFGTSGVYTLPSATPIQLNIVSTADTLHPIYNQKLNLKANNIYSLYLAGQSTAVDTLLIKENFPVLKGDSLVNVRFINLSYNSNPVTINIKGTPSVAEFSNLTYKQITAFKSYPTSTKITSYIFEIRDAATTTLLATYTFPVASFLNFTLVIKGQSGGTGTNALSLFSINNF